MRPYLTSNSDLLAAFESNRTLFTVLVVENHGHGCLGHSRLATLVNQVLNTACTNLSIETRVTFSMIVETYFHIYRQESLLHVTCDQLVMPRTKQMASRMFDFPEPLRPVMALNSGSQPVMDVRVA